MSEECTCYNASCHWLPLDGKGLKFGQQRFGTERTLEESQYNNQKNTPTQAALLPSLLKTILTVQLTNQAKILFYMELISITTHEQVSKISEFTNISKMKLIFEFKVWLNPPVELTVQNVCQLVSTCQFCFFVEPSVLKISQYILESSPI